LIIFGLVKFPFSAVITNKNYWFSKGCKLVNLNRNQEELTNSLPNEVIVATSFGFKASHPDVPASLDSKTTDWPSAKVWADSLVRFNVSLSIAIKKPPDERRLVNKYFG